MRLTDGGGRRNVFLINGHQRYEGFAEGRLNQTIFDATGKQLAAAGHEVNTTIVESGYDVAEELGKYKWAGRPFPATTCSRMPMSKVICCGCRSIWPALFPVETDRHGGRAWHLD